MRVEKFSFIELLKVILFVIWWVCSSICMFLVFLFMKIFFPEQYKRMHENNN